MTYGDEVEREIQRKYQMRAEMPFADGLFAVAVQQVKEAEESDTIKRQWWRWHRTNPHVYELFKQFTFDVIRRGHKHYSSKAIFERIRWHTEIETAGEEFKMSNNYTPYYARLFMKDFPEHAEFFRTKTLRSDGGT
jgi:hypothetical protein